MLFLLFLFTGLLHGAEFAVNLPAKLSISIEQHFEGQPIEGKIKIIRLAYQKVDPSTFQMNGRPLPVTYLGEERPENVFGTDAQTLVVSVFKFSLAPLPRGLYVLPSISVKVGDMVVTSPSMSYEVLGSKVTGELSLEAKVLEKGPIYLHEKLTFEYRISFRKPIQLTKEELPLLNFEGFRNIGAAEINNSPMGENTVQTIRQKVICETVGTFHSGPSVIEGFVYYLDSDSKPKQMSEIYRAEAPDVPITVLPFPAAGQPPSFNGAVGVFHWQVAVLGSTTVNAGEKLRLEIFVSGSGDLETVQLPDLSIQRQFKNSFAFGDLAPVGQIKDGTKQFILELRPLSDKVKEIPSIEFSSFDPVSKQYVVKKSSALPIIVRAGSKKQQTIEEPKNLDETSPIEIQKNVVLEESDLETKDLETILLAYAAGCILFLLAIQLLIRRLIGESREKKGKSRELFLEAIKKRSDPDEACRLLTSALLATLYEQNVTKEPVSHPQQLKDDGIEGEVKKLLISIDQKRFTGLQTQVEMNEIINEATQIYHRLLKV